MRDSGLELGDLILRPEPVTEMTTRFELEVHMSEQSDVISGEMIYSTDLHGRETIQRLGASWEVLLRGMIEEPNERHMEDRDTDGGTGGR
jgi:hypothetical protein